MADPFKENGFYALAPGKIGVLTTYYEQRMPFPASSPALPDGLRFERLSGRDLKRYRALFRAVGGPWLWVSRLKISDEELAAILSDEDVEALALTDGTNDLGFLELDHRRDDQHEEHSSEIRYLGLIDRAIGKGLGKILIARAFESATMRKIRRLWLHSCHIDAPSSAAFYQSHGFKATRHAIEILDDPRVSGDLPREMAPHVPLIDKRAR